ncbi:MAG: glycosyltransferase family 4 protein [Magnetospirillum sp.]|nr:glycosyltransferase family 4 protein [Magnetospirillum sp.]
MIVENLPVPRDRRVWQEACALRDAGWGVSVICPAAGGCPPGHQTIDGIAVWRHPLPREGEGLVGYLREYGAALFWEFALAWRVLASRGFDVIHACNPPETIFLVGAAFKLLGKKFLFDHHDLSPELYEAKFGRRGMLHRLLLGLERLTYRTADVAIVTNESFRQVAIERGRMAPDRVFVVRSGPDFSRLRTLAPDPALKRGARYLIAYVGVMNSQDGVEYVLEAMRHIVVDRGRADVRAVLMGDGPRLEALKEMAGALGVAGQVEFTGWADDDVLMPMLGAADVCVSPDPVNGFNDKCTMNKILEYMALSKPVVMFDLTEGRRSAGEAALYARDNDARDLAEKILGLLADADLRGRMGEIGRQRMERSLSWEHQIPRLLAAYAAIAGNGEPAHRPLAASDPPPSADPFPPQGGGGAE